MPGCAINAIHRNGATARPAGFGVHSRVFRDVAAHIPAALWIRDVDKQTVQYVNRAWRSLTGLDVRCGDPVDKAYRAIHPDDLHWVTCERRKAGGAPDSIEYRLVHPERGVHWVSARTFPIVNPSGKTPLLVEIIEDVTQRREAQRQLLHLARHDALTGLPNRTALFEGLTEAMTAAGRQAQRVSVVLLDLDQFKKVNDTLGHAIGDTLLREFAVRLAGCVRPGDTVGRLGGDEFAVIVPTAAGTQGGIEVANRIMEALKAPFAIESAVIPMTASLGISNSPEDGTDFETLLRHADAAMYEAKASGRDAVRTYDACMGAHARRQPSPTPSNVHRRNGANGMPWRAANA